jgi:hypothetical protein
MSMRHTAFALAAVTLSACASSTEPSQANTSVSDAPNIGPTLTLAGVSGLQSAGVGGIAAAVAGNPFAIASAQSRTLPPPPVCTAMPGALTQCSLTFDGITFGYTYGWQDSLGLRAETRVSGTLAAADGQPARRLDRQGVSWTMVGSGSNPALSGRQRSNETGTTEQLTTPRVISVDTGSADIRFTLTPGTGTDSRIPRLVGTSRRVIWTRRDGSAATFWRETTTYDSSTVIRSVIETPSGTRRCELDLAATQITTVCR